MVREMNKSSSLERNERKKNTVFPEIGKQIDKVRFTHGYSRPALSKGAGITKTQLNETVNGKLNPTPDALDRIALFLDVPSDYLLITYHEDFLLYAIDDYLFRIYSDSFSATILDILSLVGIQDGIMQSVKEQLNSFTSSISSQNSIPDTFDWKKKIRRFRKEAGYSQATASEALGVSYNHYVKFENEITNMSLLPHLRVCLLYGKSSESITHDKRNDMVLTKKQLDALHQLDHRRLVTLLETLRAIYENSNR